MSLEIGLQIGRMGGRSLRTDDDAVTVPFDAVEIRMDLARVA